MTTAGTFEDGRRAHPVDATGHDASGACANCGARLTGPFCAACGQHGHVHRTMGAFLHDVAHGVFHFEGRFWSTLPMLALKPGELTRRYVAGERARFVSPMAMFLFSVFLMFAVVSKLPFLDAPEKVAAATAGTAQLRARVADERGRLAGLVRDGERRLARRVRDDADDPERIAEARDAVAAAKRELTQVTAAERLLAAPARTPGSNADGAGEWLQAKLDHARDNPQLVAYKMKSSAYKYSWALIPISLPFIWLLFPRRRDVGMYDHAVFATYSLGFMSLMLVALSLVGLVTELGGLVGLAGTLIPPVHIYRHLKGAYGLTRAGALWRTGWMLVFTLLTSGLFVMLMTWLGTA